MSPGRLFRTLVRDQRGAVNLIGYLLLVALVGLGVLVGLDTIRIELIQRLGNAATALENINQSYSYTVGTVTSVFVDTPPGSVQTIDVQLPASQEQ